MTPRRLVADRRGNISLMAAGVGGLVCMTAALAVDLGSIALDARRLQGSADLSAMAAAARLAEAQAAALRTASANTPGAVDAEVTLGRYVADRTVASESRFQADPLTPNAVRVRLSSESRLFFGAMILRKPSVRLTRVAVASAPDQPAAAFSIGSRLASLDGGIANQLLSALTGSSVSLSVMDYNALAGARVNLLTFSQALGTELGLEVGDYEGLLKQEIDAGRALRVLETLAGSASSSALSRLSTAAAGSTIRIGDLIAVEPDGEDLLAQGLDAQVGVMDLTSALLRIGAGDRQVALNLGAHTGLASLTVDLGIGEPPAGSGWITVTRGGEPIIRTAQARLGVRARTSQKVSGLAQLDLPLVLELAQSEAKLNKVNCVDGAASSAEIGVRPGVAQAHVAAFNATELADFKRPLPTTPAQLLNVAGLVGVKGQAHVEIADTGFKPLVFSADDIRAARVKTMSTSQIGTSLTSSLLQRLSLDVNVLGLGLGLGGLSQAIGALLQPIGPVIDAALNPLLELLGLKIGQADVVTHAASCAAGRVKLVR